MLEKRVSDLKFGKLTKMYGRSVSYQWEVNQYVLKIKTTGHLLSQRKFREAYLEASGVAVLRISTEAWTMIINQAMSTSEQHTEAELENMWIDNVAAYCALKKRAKQQDIALGFVYETTTGFIFTSAGLADYMSTVEEMDCCSPEWHHDKLINLLNVKSSSVTLKNFKGRAIKLNNFSCRVDRRFYNRYSELQEEEYAA